MVTLLTAGILSGLLGLVHSIMGERLIFREWRQSQPHIRKRHQNIIWATWHVVTAIGLGLCAGLIWLSNDPALAGQMSFFLTALSVGYFVGAVLVLFATKAKHPGWIVMAFIAVLLII